ncbi:nitrogenase component 1 [Clostridium rectalis]|uniref:nitrogenase component 1 n=1 Tax=Clostridium rectalis TaxID=2040295 RepID=UPI000F62FC05|nr:nitrogenase component 1 [Clostridium rectalis]
MKQIAIYGKGGIGKSTISSNLSAAFSKKDKRVLQIGCDPKHDSTRLLLGGRKINTVLDYIREVAPDKYRLNDILWRGYNGIHCVEAGGPNPGVGCAGRGILTTFDLLERFNIKNKNYDIVLYDVLGDVVCGGFAVPLRHEYADEVYIVTSGEFMSIYAANNILRGLRNYDGTMKRVGGLIFNKRGVEKEEERIKRFADAVKLPICQVFPRSNEFTYSEKIGLPLVEIEESKVSYGFLNLADKIIEDTMLYEALPLTDEKLEEVVLQRKEKSFLYKNKIEEKVKKEEIEEEDLLEEFLSKNVLLREPLHGCAFNGGVNVAIQIEDAVTIAHGPRSCAHISYQTITSVGRRGFFERGELMPVQINPSLVSSEMNEGVMVFGGTDALKKTIKRVEEKGKALFVITTCPAGIIGDDVDSVKEMSRVDKPIIPIKTDGNITGDYLQGMIKAYIQIAKGLIKRDVIKKENTVNILSEKFISRNTEKNFNTMKEILEFIGVSINCRFICKTRVEDIENFMSANLNILAHDDYMGRLMKKFFQDEYNAKFFKTPFPIGFSDTKQWIKEISKYFNKEELVKDLIIGYEEEYKKEIEKIKPYLIGKKIMIITYNHQLDWILETLIHLQMDIVKVCVLNFCGDNLFKSRFENMLNIELKYNQDKRLQDIKSLKPDIIISNYATSNLDENAVVDTIPMCPDAGFFSGLNLAKRWAGLFKLNLKEGWRKDEKLFCKYYSR